MNKNLLKLLETQMKLSKIMNEERMLTKQIEMIQDGCNHEIIISSGSHDAKVVKGLVAYPKTCCLFCQKNIEPRKYLPEKEIEKIKKSVKIDFNDFPKLYKMWDRRWMTNLIELYKEIKKQNPGLTDYEVGMKMIGMMKIFEGDI